MIKNAFFAAVAATALFASGAASATVVAQESFEAPGLTQPGLAYGPDVDPNFNLPQSSPPASIPNFSFQGWSGIISNGTGDLFPNTASGNQAAFLQSFVGSGSEIDWTLNGLTAGNNYQLSFDSVGSIYGEAVPGQSFTVSDQGGGSSYFTPGASYAGYTFNFTPISSTDTIRFLATFQGGDHISAIDNLKVSDMRVAPAPAPALAGAPIGLAGLGKLTSMLRRRRRRALAA
jgi:hypothetical protein